MDALTKTKAAQATTAGTNAARTAGMYFTTRKISVPHLNVAFQENTDEVVYRVLLHAGHCRACIELVAAHRSSLSIDGGSFGGFGGFFLERADQFMLTRLQTAQLVMTSSATTSGRHHESAEDRRSVGLSVHYLAGDKITP